MTNPPEASHNHPPKKKRRYLLGEMLVCAMCGATVPAGVGSEQALCPQCCLPLKAVQPGPPT